MKTKSIKGKSTEEVKAALENSMTDGFNPTLAMAFTAKSLDRTAISNLLDSKEIKVFGCTTHGEFIDEEPESDSAAILLLELNKEYFEIYFEEYTNTPCREVSSSISKKAKSRFKKPAFIISTSNAQIDGEEILRGFEDVCGEEVTIFGGGAGDNYAFMESFVFSNHKESNSGLICIAFDEAKIEINGISNSGWKAVGTEKTVTKSEGNHVYTIDNIPALDITAKYGGIQNISPDNQSLMVEIAANFPLQLQRENGDPVMRPGLMVDWDDHSFYTGGAVPQGSKVRFSLPPDFDVVEKVVREVEKFKSEVMPDADAVVIFNCGGRILSLGPLITQELEGIKNVWKVPMAGMFSNSEFGRATGGGLEMHNLTTCTIALKEK